MCTDEVRLSQSTVESRPGQIGHDAEGHAAETSTKFLDGVMPRPSHAHEALALKRRETS
jgi:hypothetical protein